MMVYPTKTLLFNHSTYVLLKNIVHIIASKNRVWKAKMVAPITEAKYIKLFSSVFISIVNKSNIIDAIATQNNITTIRTQSSVLPEFIYLNVELIQSIDGMRINIYNR